jgi:hypothetical protein
MNKVLMNIEVPAFWYLNSNAPESQEEIEFKEKLNQKVVFLEL